jgi:hypothetical protein
MRDYSGTDYWSGLEKQVRQADAEIARGEGMSGEQVERFFAEMRGAAADTARKAAC